MAEISETPYRIEPLGPKSFSTEIVDLLTEIAAASARLGARLHPETALGLASLVRLTNCYYSQLIEGNNTEPREIEQAMQDQFSADENTRDLQLEARAHVRLQAEIDHLHAVGQLGEPLDPAFLKWLHKEFYQDAAASSLDLPSPSGGTFPMTPGQFRQPGEPEVQVGRHVPPSAEALSGFLDRLGEAYRLDGKGSGQCIVAMAAAHHRLNYVHPFHDGNGRVSRLVAHAMGLKAGIGAHGLWSISRGLARGIEHQGEYKMMMASADALRRGDRDGRGHLSEAALAEFIGWFLRICLDQLTFMSRMFDFDRLSSRLSQYASDQKIHSEAEPVLRTLLERGEISRGEVSRIAGIAPRTASILIRRLIEDGIVGSPSSKGPLRLRFDTRKAEVLFPNLFRAVVIAPPPGSLQLTGDPPTVTSK